MNVGTIVTPTAKGQIVIPSVMRKYLGIDQNTYLQIKLVGDGIYLQPTQTFPMIQGDNGAFLAMLKKVQGSWGPESAEEKKQAIKYKRFELAAAKKNRNTW